MKITMKKLLELMSTLRAIGYYSMTEDERAILDAFDRGQVSITRDGAKGLKS